MPLSAETMASSSSSWFRVCVTTCGFIGMSLRVPRSSISSFQVFMRSCAFFRNLLLLPLQQGQQRLKNGLRVADQGRIHLVAQADARGVELDLNALRLTRLGQELHVRIAGADHDERVALLHRIDRGRGAEQAKAAGGVRAAIRQDGLAQQGLDHGAADGFGQLSHFFARARAPRPTMIVTLRAVVNDVGGALRRRAVGGLRVEGAAQSRCVLRCWRCCASCR